MEKMLELVGGGSVINGAYTVQFIPECTEVFYCVFISLLIRNTFTSNNLTFTHPSYKFSQIEMVFLHLYFISYTLLHCIAFMFRAVQCSTVQAVYCTNFKSTPLICIKLFKAAYSLLQKVYSSFCVKTRQPTKKL